MTRGIEAESDGASLVLFAYDRRKLPLTGTGCKTARFPGGKPVQASLGSAAKMVRPAGIEPATLGFGGQYSIH